MVVLYYRLAHDDGASRRNCYLTKTIDISSLRAADPLHTQQSRSYCSAAWRGDAAKRTSFDTVHGRRFRGKHICGNYSAVQDSWRRPDDSLLCLCLHLQAPLRHALGCLLASLQSRIRERHTACCVLPLLCRQSPVCANVAMYQCQWKIEEKPECESPVIQN